MSSSIATKCVMTPWWLRMGEMEAEAQHSSPFFILLRNSPRHSRPEVIVSHSRRNSSGEVFSDFKIRGFWPMTSSGV